jgi:hypothetical protein
MKGNSMNEYDFFTSQILLRVAIFVTSPRAPKNLDTSQATFKYNSSSEMA